MSSKNEAPSGGDLKKKYRSYNSWMGVLFIGAFSILAVSIFAGVWFVGVPAAVALFVLGFVLARKRDALKEALDRQTDREIREILLPVLGEYFTVSSFDKNGRIDGPHVQAERVSGDCLLTGSFNGMAFSCSNLTREHTEITGSDANQESRTVVDFSGCCLRCHLDRPLTDETLKAVKALVGRVKAPDAGLHIRQTLPGREDPASVVVFASSRLFLIFGGGGAIKEEKGLRRDAEFLRDLLSAVAEGAAS